MREILCLLGEHTSMSYNTVIAEDWVLKTVDENVHASDPI